MHFPKNIIISRTDSIGDVVLTLPMAKVLKDYYPSIKIGFMGKAYTKPVVEACTFVDEFIDVKDFLDGEVTVCGQKPEAIIHVFPVPNIATRAMYLRIKLRIGTGNRFYHRLTCNKLVKLSRRKSVLHEAQLNLQLLAPLGIAQPFTLEQISNCAVLQKTTVLPAALSALISKDKFNLILHPKSQGSGREWPLSHYVELIRALNLEQYKIFISGTVKERLLLTPLFDEVSDKVEDVTGKMTLTQFIAFINQCDGLIAASTGPLHIAAALGKNALGIFAPMRPIHPGRWAPLGPKAQVFVIDKPLCTACKKLPAACACIVQVNPATLKTALEKLNTPPQPVKN